MGTPLKDLKSNLNPYDDIKRLQELQQTHYNTTSHTQHEQNYNPQYNMEQQQPHYKEYSQVDHPQYPLQDIQQREQQEMQQLAMQQEEMQRQQQEEMQRHQQQKSRQQKHQSKHQSREISDLTREISENLKENNDDDYTSDEVKKTHEVEETGYISYIPSILREPLIVLFLYVLLSHVFVRESIGKYIKQTTPNEMGVVTFAGILIYGIIFATLFGIMKYFIIKK